MAKYYTEEASTPVFAVTFVSNRKGIVPPNKIDNTPIDNNTITNTNTNKQIQLTNSQRIRIIELEEKILLASRLIESYGQGLVKNQAEEARTNNIKKLINVKKGLSEDTPVSEEEIKNVREEMWEDTAPYLAVKNCLIKNKGKYKIAKIICPY